LFLTPSTTCAAPLSLHDALPIFLRAGIRGIPPGNSIFERDIWSITAVCYHQLRLPAVYQVYRREALRAKAFRWFTFCCFGSRSRSEEHTSELQSRFDLVCRLLLE